MIAPNLIGRSRLAGVALLAGTLLLPLAKADPPQEERKAQSITVSGSAVLPDGRPGANLPVEIKEPTHYPLGNPGSDRPPPATLPESGFRLLAKGTTDAQGKFSIKFEPRGAKVLQLDVGRRTESAWIKKPLRNSGKDIDLGELQLRDRVPEK